MISVLALVDCKIRGCKKAKKKKKKSLDVRKVNKRGKTRRVHFIRHTLKKTNLKTYAAHVTVVKL